jgi:hypothetical protein
MENFLPNRALIVSITDVLAVTIGANTLSMSANRTIETVRRLSNTEMMNASTKSCNIPGLLSLESSNRTTKPGMTKLVKNARIAVSG